MRKWRIVIGLAVVASMLVGASAASAGSPEGPDLSNTSFLVTVEDVDGLMGGGTFTNCYSFGGDAFTDPMLPPGTWTGSSDGPLTHYTATTSIGTLLQFSQTGFVTQSLTLHAKSTVSIAPGFPLPAGEYRFVSNGHAVDSCPTG